MNQLTCTNCKADIAGNDRFCPGCGKPIEAEFSNSDNVARLKVKTITSSGSYSGTMVKGKKSKALKILRNIVISIIGLGIIALIVWFQVDPEAGKKLTDVLVGTGFMVVFFFIGWLFMRGKKGKNSTNWDGDEYSDLSVDDNDD